jgi:predicted ATPase/DNA-binding CsgD family transcriptional regulator
MTVREAHIHNLPPQPTPFVGRQSEITDIVNRLQDKNCRLLTLVGSGGIGKTRLAVESIQHLIQSNFQHGVFYVPLAPLTSPDNIVTTIINVLGILIGDEGTPQEELVTSLSQRNLLLVMDNFEHILAGAEIVTDILNSATNVKILVTSRETLNLRMEHVWQVHGMRYPDSKEPEDINQYDALNLFVERALQIRRNFSLGDEQFAIIQICQLVDGLPLAIELAAGWLKTLSCNEIIKQIELGVDFLATQHRDVPERHRSMRAVYDHSWQLLSADEQAVFVRLSVFRGGFTREAAEYTANADHMTLSGLIEKSMIRRDASGRYECHELLRQYAQQQFEATNIADEIENAHSDYFLSFLAQREADIKGRRQFEALDEIEYDFENVRVAWVHAVQHRNYDALNPTLECLDWFCTYRGRWQEGLDLFRYAREGLVPAIGEEPHLAWGRIMIRDEGFHGFTPFETAWKQIEQCLALAKQHDDQGEVAYCLNSLGNAASVHESADYDASLHYWSESLAKYTELNDAHYVAYLNQRIGSYYGAMRQGAKYIEFMRHSYDLMREKGDHMGVIGSRMDLGLAIKSNSNLITYESEDANIADKLETWNRISFLVIEQGTLNFFDGDFEKASELISQGLKDLSTLNLPPVEKELHGKASIVTGLIAGIQEHYPEAKRTLEQIQFTRSSFFDTLMDLGLAIATFGVGDYPTARQHLQTGLAFLFDSQQLEDLLTYIPVAAIFMAHNGKLVQAVELLGLAYHHPSSTTGWLERWQLLNRVRDDLEAELGASSFSAAWKRGKGSDLAETVIQLLAWLNHETPSESNAIDYANQRLAEPLTSRELEVLALLVEGQSNHEIAEQLTVVIGTIKAHVYNICQKLTVRNRLQAVLEAKKIGLL